MNIKQNVTVITGAFWGDEGKDRVSFYQSKHAYMCLRASGGNNEKHTIVYNGNKYSLYFIPSAIVKENVICAIGPDVMIDPQVLITEIIELQKIGINITPENLIISDKAHIIMPYHKEIDVLQANIVSFASPGIGSCYTDKFNGNGITMRDLKDHHTFLSDISVVNRIMTDPNLISKISRPLGYHNAELEVSDMSECKKDITSLYELCTFYSDMLYPYIQDLQPHINKALEEGKKIVIEDAQAYDLDIDHNGYPCVTNSPNIYGTLSGLGIGATYIKEVVGVCKSYCSRTDIAPFPTEERNGIGDIIRKVGHEYDSTGRLHRCGWLDISTINHSKYILGYNCLCINNLDTIGNIAKELGYISIRISDSSPVDIYRTFYGGWDTTGCTKYEDLPKNAKRFVEVIEAETGLPVKYIGIGPDNANTIIRSEF